MENTEYRLHLMPGNMTHESNRKMMKKIKSFIIQRILYLCGLKTLICMINLEEGGVDKRLDEQREFYEFIRLNAPEVLFKHNWVSGFWLQGADRYFTEIRAEMIRLGLHKRGAVANIRKKPDYYRIEPDKADGRKAEG